MADCVWQAASVTGAGHVMTTAGAGVTVKVAVQVFGASQSEVTVKVAVATPPQAEGAAGLLLVSTPLQPPVKEAVAFHAVNFESIVD